MKNRLWIKRWGLVLALALALPIIPLTTQYISSRKAHAQLGGGYQLSSLSYLRKVIFLVNKHYVDRRQIDPPKMFRDALKRIQLLVPSILIRMPKGKKTVEVFVDKKRKTFTVKSFPVVFSVPFQLRPIFAFIEKNYRGDIALRKIEFAAIHGILSSLDPHTGFLPPSYYKDMQLHTDGKFGGLGIVIQNKDGFLTVLSPMPGTPASRVGIRPMDRIVRIGDESTINMSLNEAVTRLRGHPGTKAVIWVQRKGFAQPKRFEIVRAIIRVKSVTWELLSNKVGYVRIKHFQKDTAREVRRALKMFHEKTKGMRGLVLDLRSNPGGLLNQAVAVSDIFLDKGTVVTHAGGASQREEHRANKLGTEPKYPIVVLVNRGSASASEIVSGALKNHNRAIIVGQQTYGKGTVQVLFPIYPPRYFSRERSALKLTVAQYLTPGDISIQKIGITPDIAVHAVHITKKQVHFFGSDEARKFKNKKMPRFLRGFRERRKPEYRLSYLDRRSNKERATQYREDYSKKKKFRPDFEVALAKKLVVATSSWSRKAFLKNVKKRLDSVRKKESKKIHRALRKAGVVWKKGKSTAKARIRVQVKLLPLPPEKKKKGKKAEPNRPPKGDMVWAGSRFRLQVSIRNRSSKPLYRVRAVSLSKYWFFNRQEFAFGMIRPGKTKKWSATFKVPKWVKSQVHKLELQVSSSNKVFSVKKTQLLKIQGYKRPRFDFSYALEEVKGNGDDLIQPGESFALRVRVRNQGGGASFPVTGLLKNKTGREVFIKVGRIRFPALKKNQHATSWFYFKVHPRTSKKSIDLQLSIFDTKLLTTVQRMLSLRVYPAELNRKSVRGESVRIKGRWIWAYGGAALDAPRIARIAGGTTLRVLGQLGPFIQVALPKKLWGKMEKKAAKKHKPMWRVWVPRRDTQRIQAKKKTALKARLFWQSVTPTIDVKGSEKPLLSKKKTFILKGSIRNNVSLLDAYILVNSEKVFYRALQNAPKVGFHLPIKLKKGDNRILIFARESVKFSGYREIHVFYKGK